MITYNQFMEKYKDKQLNVVADSKNTAKANKKRIELNIPYHHWLSNRFVLYKVVK